MEMGAEIVVKKTVKLDLDGLDGNAFSLIGAFQRAARRQGWAPDEINAVRFEATRKDYDHLLQVLVLHTEAE